MGTMGQLVIKGSGYRVAAKTWFGKFKYRGQSNWGIDSKIVTHADKTVGGLFKQRIQ